MARNDAILVDALIDQRISISPELERGEVFEHFVLEQILKSFDLSEEELVLGWTDGRHDGGIDAFYTLVNGRLVSDPNTFSWPRSHASAEIFIVTCKHRDSFKQEPLDSLLASLHEIFDLSKPTSSLDGAYSSEIKQCREVFIASYKQLSLLRPRLTFRVIYASRGDTSSIGESIVARGVQIKRLLESYFSAAEASFEVLGAAELVELYRHTKSFSLSLPFREHLTADQDGYVVLASLADYCAFVTDDRGALRRYLFDSNVRDFLGDNAVNSDIASTLRDTTAPNFWWLNNGVTILATSATVIGKQLQLQDIQIVNGLQTTESIYLHFSATPETRDSTRCLLIKVIVSGDEKIRDQVIRATNNQSAVQPAALHATEKIQHDIEQILAQRDWFYERRTNYFRNAGRPENRIVTPLFVASGVVALLLKDPPTSVLRQKRLRNPEAYELVFSETHPIHVWPVIVECLKQAEAELTRARLVKVSARPRFLATWRGLLSFLVVARHFGTYHYSAQSLAELLPESLRTSQFTECWTFINSFINDRSPHKPTISFMNEICAKASETFKISGSWADACRPLPKEPRVIRPQVLRESKRHLIPELRDAIDHALPGQPWKPGVHLIVANELKVHPDLVIIAIQQLIQIGRRHRQKDGVVYDTTGGILAVDRARAAVDAIASFDALLPAPSREDVSKA